MKRILGIFIAFSMILTISVTFGCAQQGAAKKSGGSVVVFVPGAVTGSPIYEQLVSGAKRAVAEVPSSTVQVIEAGFNQAEWPEKLKTLASSGTFDWIVTSNTAMPEICADAATSFPNQKFLVVDGWLKGNPQIHTSLYNQVEQGYLAGYLAGLTAGAKKASPVIGVVAAQNYPALDKAILPGFLEGAKAAAPGATIDLRIVGNWYDANKAAELSNALFDSGCEVILPVAGGAGQGVISSAKEKGKKIVWLDSSGYSLAPGIIIGCATLSQEKLVYERVKAALSGKLTMGEAELLSAKDGWIDFDDKAPEYVSGNSETIRGKMDILLASMRSGKFIVPEPVNP